MAERAGTGYWDAQARHFEAVRLLHARASGSGSASGRREDHPRWTVLVDDDSFVNVPALLSLVRRFDHLATASPLLIGHVLDGVWPSVRGFSGGAGTRRSQPHGAQIPVPSVRRASPRSLLTACVPQA